MTKDDALEFFIKKGLSKKDAEKEVRAFWVYSVENVQDRLEEWYAIIPR